MFLIKKNLDTIVRNYTRFFLNPCSAHVTKFINLEIIMQGNLGDTLKKSIDNYFSRKEILQAVEHNIFNCFQIMTN